MSKENPPSVGRIVHYLSTSSNDFGTTDRPRVKAAIVTAVRNESVVDLFIFEGGEGSGRGKAFVAETTKGERGCWCWPPFVASSGPASKKTSKAAPTPGEGEGDAKPEESKTP